MFGCAPPRDVLITVGNEILESTMSYRSRWFEYLFRDEYRQLSQEPLFDAADIAPVGKDLFVQLSLVTNRSGYRWIKQHFPGHSTARSDQQTPNCSATSKPTNGRSSPLPTRCAAATSFPRFASAAPGYP